MAAKREYQLVFQDVECGVEDEAYLNGLQHVCAMAELGWLLTEY